MWLLKMHTSVGYPSFSAIQAADAMGKRILKSRESDIWQDCGNPEIMCHFHLRCSIREEASRGR